MTAPFVRILNGDVLDHLRGLPDDSVHCCVTSPPYWGLRDFSRCGCARVIGGATSGMPNFAGDNAGQGRSSPDPRNEKQPNPSCPICHGTGKIAGTERQLGLEPTHEQYIANMTAVFHEVKRVLRKDGTLWCNMGDCYASQGGPVKETFNDIMGGKDEAQDYQSSRKPPSGLKPKDLVGQPWRLAFALQADGWYLRSDIIWAKPNPMPESVTDRPTKAHEYIFLLSKSPRYFYDQEAVREKNANPERTNYAPGKEAYSIGNIHEPNDYRQSRNDGFKAYADGKTCIGRNSRTVWEIATQPYPEAHFATFPEELPRRCIKAGTSEKGCCPKCGSPWERIVSVDYEKNRPSAGNDPRSRGEDRLSESREIFGSVAWKGNNLLRNTKTLGWQPTCSCNESETVPCVVLDPFAGSGTTGAVARSMGRSSILIELNPEYVKLIRERCETSHVALEAFVEVGDVPEQARR